DGRRLQVCATAAGSFAPTARRTQVSEVQAYQLRRRRFFTGLPVGGREVDAPLPDLAWYTPDGREMTGEDWGNDFGRSVALFVNGEGIRERGQYGQRHHDSSFLLCFNAHDAPLEFTMPGSEFGQKWELVISTAEPDRGEVTVISAGGAVRVPDRSLVVLERTV
ncbi:glycogen debranching enzyme, partial [Micromonospora musae]